MNEMAEATSRRTSSANIDKISSIEFTDPCWYAVVAHARRKLEGRWIGCESEERQAFGLLAGDITGAVMRTTRVFPLRRNLRHDPNLGAFVDAAVAKLATPSKTPAGQRGWLADPREVLEVQAQCDLRRELLYGSYHMHKVAWKHDPLRDTPTRLDAALAQHSAMWMLILSMVDPDRPLLRAFFEGCTDREVPIRRLS
jgi:hypothetical protein